MVRECHTHLTVVKVQSLLNDFSSDHYVTIPKSNNQLYVVDGIPFPITSQTVENSPCQIYFFNKSLMHAWASTI